MIASMDMNAIILLRKLKKEDITDLYLHWLFRRLFNVIKAWAFKEHGVRPRDFPRVIKEHREILHDMPVDQTSELFDLFFVLSIGEAEVKESYKFINKYYLLTNDA